MIPRLAVMGVFGFYVNIELCFFNSLLGGDILAAKESGDMALSHASMCTCG